VIESSDRPMDSGEAMRTAIALIQIDPADSGALIALSNALDLANLTNVCGALCALFKLLADSHPETAAAVLEAQRVQSLRMTDGPDSP
jgi:hypothetical protein